MGSCIFLEKQILLYFAFAIQILRLMYICFVNVYYVLPSMESTWIFFSTDLDLRLP